MATSTARILDQVNELRREIAAARTAQSGLWPHPDYASIDDAANDADARHIGREISRWEREIESLALQVTEATDEWPGGWLLGSTAGRNPGVWIVPRHLGHAAGVPAWRTRVEAEAALADARPAAFARAASEPLPGWTPRRPASWWPPESDGDGDGWRACWVGATRTRVVPTVGGTVALEAPLDRTGWTELGSHQ